MADCWSWEAWYNRMPGAQDPNLYVAGKCGARSSSITFRLEPGQGIPSQETMYLELHEEDPGTGDDQYVVRDVSWQDDVGQDIAKVQISGASDATVDVEIRE